MSTPNNSSSGGIAFPSLLFLVFLVLKLTDYIDWSWWWVTAPLWGCFVIVVLCVIGLALIEHYAENRPRRRR